MSGSDPEASWTAPIQPTEKMVERMIAELRTYRVAPQDLTDDEVRRLVADLWAEARYASPTGGRKQGSLR